MATIPNVVRAQVILPRVNGTPADAVSNTFHFQVDPGTTNDQAAGIFDDFLIAFYNDAADNTVIPIRQFLATSLDRTANACSIKFDSASVLGDTPTIVHWTLGDNNSGSYVDLPGEIAICLSLRADTWHSRHGRGRIFLGPCHARVLQVATGRGDPRVKDEIQQAIKASALKLADSLLHPYGLHWVIPNYGLGTARPITSGFVDDAFDIQRRRGVKTQSRVSWAVA
jgi:hypothetical protein